MVNGLIIEQMAFTGRSIPSNFKVCICLVVCIFVASFVLLQIDDASVSRVGLPKWRTSGANRIILSETSGTADGDKTHYILESFQGRDDKGSRKTNGSASDLLFIFTRANEIRHLERKLVLCLTSILRHASSAPLNLHIITDSGSLPIAKRALHGIFEKDGATSTIQVTLYDVARIVEPLQETVIFLQPHFSYKPGTYYSNALFFLSVALHRVLPQRRVVAIDIDTKFAADVHDLVTHFDRFDPGAVMGLAHEQQPVYLHLLHEYRQKFPKTLLGGPPPKGIPGFNSGVMLLNLERMRQSPLYNSLVNATVVDELTKKYMFKGHLGDQDFFTLLSFDYPQLFYVLPCNWNRQLCQWWKHHGYKNVFNSYYKCTGKVLVYHGNCNTVIQ